MKLHQLPTPAAFASLHSQPTGLTPVEAARRLREFGPNHVGEVRRKPLALRLAREFTHFFALILWVAALLALVAEYVQPGQGMAMLGWAILAVILINGLFSFWQEYRAERAIDALRQLLPQQVLVLRDGITLRIPAEQLVPGDIVFLQAGDSVPADCRLIEAFGVRVNNAIVTGESLPKARNADPSTEEDPLRSKNVVLAGTSVVSGEARALVFATGMHTEFGKIAHLTQRPRETPSPLQQEIARVSRLVAVLATAMGVVFFVVGQFIGLSFWANSLFAIGIIVANVPEGLLPTVTLSLAMATQRMAKKNALVRHLPAVETLGSATVICTDKTGTLTQNRMEARQAWLGGRVYDVAALGSAQAAMYAGFFETAGYCHNLKPTEAGWLGDPMEIALVELARRTLPGLPPLTRIDELPFDTDRKRVSIIYRAVQGQVIYCKGAPETVLPLCTHIQCDDGVQVLSDALRQQLQRAQDAMAERGLRILALAQRVAPEDTAHDAREGQLTLSGLIGFEDPPRPEVPEALRRCRAAGIKVIMVTGDHPHTATAIAREIGLTQGSAPLVITGDMLGRLSRTQLQLALDAPDIIFARVGADQKLRIVEALQRKQHIVAVTGDGVNDAPALKQAHIGIAMGLTGTDVAKQAADMILLDDNFASIVNAVEEGRAVFDNIRKFLAYILTSNIPEIVPYLAFALFKIPLPLTIVQILAVDLGTDLLPALGLGADKPDPTIMDRPPRPHREPLLTRPLLLRAYLFLGVFEAVAAMAAFFYVLNQGGWHYGDVFPAGTDLYRQATTATFSAIIVMQIANVFLVRSPTASLVTPNAGISRLVWWGVVTEICLVLLVAYTPWGNDVLGTAPIAADVWLYVVPFAVAMVVAEEVRKWVVRRRARGVT